ncbi:MAG: 30S ribosome-binding factor RbfA [Bacilli bacterium]|jgi:ribosome-binding factor A
MKIRTERLASNLQTEISHIIANDMKDEDVKFVTITYVKLTEDLNNAKIYFTTLLDDKREEVLLTLNKARGFLKSELCKRKLKIRKIPEMEFIYDKSIEQGNKIEKIIKQLGD